MTYQGVSYWLETCGDPLVPRPALKGGATVDVAILGGGFSGLWTAYYLLKDNPGLEVAIVEKEVCGYGASGRNGGWCSPRYPLNPDVIERRYGADVARRTVQAMYDTVEEVGRVCAEEGIDADFRLSGILSIARGQAQVDSVLASHATYSRLGFGDGNRLLGADEAREMVKVTGMVSAMHTPKAGALHPAKLARGLARTVERLGGVIYEQTEVLGIETGASPALKTSGGTLKARRAVVAAGEAYLPRLAPYGRTVLPMSSSIVLTRPLTKAQWAQIGWEGGQNLGSQAYTIDYLSKTPDGRILYGSRGAPYAFGSSTEGGEAAAAGLYDHMRQTVREWFPAIGADDFSHAWTGFLGVTRDWSPCVGFDAERKVGGMYGYTGRGVSTTNLAGRLQASQIMGRETELATLPLAQHSSRSWEPEPLRWLGVRYIQDAFRRMDTARDAGERPPIDAEIAKALATP